MTTAFVPTTADIQAARVQLQRLQARTDNIPDRLAHVLEDLLEQIAAGKAVQLLALDTEIGTQQAAELLSVSRPYLVKLLEGGALPHRKVGPRRRLYLQDVLAYQTALDTQRQAALQALADDLQELGLD